MLEMCYDQDKRVDIVASKFDAVFEYTFLPHKILILVSNSSKLD